MTVLRILLSACWFLFFLLYSIEGNEIFTQMAFRWGIVAALALAFTSGWVYLWLGALALPDRIRVNVAAFWALVLGGVFVLLGLYGLHEIWTNSADPEYYKVNGVGPVHMVAYLAQAVGMLMSLRHLRSLRRKAQAIPTAGLGG